ncbi:MAG TPA: polysaccharide biosynthesis/export family protein [Candidatus Binatia bacterium]|nr:polysaccharide biosynthesis/export family protein [Candidatus Binatia bacterium]
MSSLFSFLAMARNPGRLVVLVLAILTQAACVAEPARSTSLTGRPTDPGSKVTSRTNGNAPARLGVPVKAAPTTSKIGTGDAVSMVVLGRPEMTTNVNVAEDGSIPVPLVGPVVIAGLSPREASTRVAEALEAGDYLVHPNVTLTLTQQYYIYGEVQQPNMYKLEPGMTVIQAVARSGGVTPRGSDSRIEITRRDENGELHEFSAERSDPVRPNDVIRVKQRIF